MAALLPDPVVEVRMGIIADIRDIEFFAKSMMGAECTLCLWQDTGDLSGKPSIFLGNWSAEAEVLSILFIQLLGINNKCLN